MPVYGTKGTPSVSNSPGTRTLAFPGWVDENGDLWLFGGARGPNDSIRNDLWKYNISSGAWTWMHGNTSFDSPGIYGTKGVSSPANTPGARDETTCSWVDSAGNFWLFGGRGYDVNGDYGLLNDLWRYDPGANEWTWMNGSNTVNDPGVYGVKGTPDSNNRPSGRWVYSHWKDDDGDLWLFGGQGNFGYYSDLWKYDVSANEWAWMHGPNTSNDAGTFGTKGVPSSSNNPPAIMETRACWQDDCYFYLFGGNSMAGCYNTLWRYDPETDEWTWLHGKNTANDAGKYGTKGMASPSNMPAASKGAVSWRDDNGNFWLFGGFVFSEFSVVDALWKYVPEVPTCNPAPVSIVSFNGKQEKQVNVLQWTTASEINNDYFTIEKSPDGDDFEIFATVEGSGNSNTEKNYHCTDNEPFEDVAYYRLKQTDFDGTYSYSGIVSVQTDTIPEQQMVYNIHPSPANNVLHFIAGMPENSEVTVKITNSAGQTVLRKPFTCPAGKNELSLDVSGLPEGVYFINMETTSGRSPDSKMLMTSREE